MGFRIHDAARLHHAYIIASADPALCRARADEIARAAVCRSPSDVPCGQCRACRKALAGIHPDIQVIRRLEDSKGRPRREIVVDQIREMAADAVVLPNESERKVYLIEDADTMNVSAQNAALKLLEEPPAGVIFLLCVTNPQQLLPTVRSRCAEVNVNGEQAPEDEETRKLAESFVKTVAKGDAAELARWCAKNEIGEIRAATSFVESVSAFCAEMLCLRKSDLGMRPAEIARLHALCERCLAMLRVNVGAKHIFGLLSVNAIASDRNEEIHIG